MDTQSTAGDVEPTMLRARFFQPGDEARWDELVERSGCGTFLHTRRFLSYHGTRFADRSLMFEDHKGRLLGLLPAALDTRDATTVISHPGITYGGLLHDGALHGAAALQALTCARQMYAAQNLRRLRYKAVPWIYHRMPAQDDLYALFRLNAALYRRDLTSTIDLSARGSVSQRRRRGLKKAQLARVQVEERFDAIDAFWPLLEANLASRHGLVPVHTLQEIRLLHERFPQRIRLLTARCEGQVRAGVLLFETGRVSHAQYTASDESARTICALDAVFEFALERARENGARFFDFGVSTESDGSVLNEGLNRFKNEFGASGVVHDFYQIELN